ncbi:DUF1629 domain-containing protein [Psychroserpens sp. AS72]|uniref:imm11 family protein n=1 Tax=Psychroserpens sp. AS72 TaxID=3135775 RepID=UPI00316E5896
MEYSQLKLSSDRKVIGKGGYPQCKGSPLSLGLTLKWFDQPNSMTNLTNEEFPSFLPNLIFELEDKAFLTDAISPSNLSAKGFLISSKLKSIIETHNLMEHKFFKARVIFKEENYDYFWLHFKDNKDKYLNAIDYKNSQFYVANLAFMHVRDIDLSCYEDYKQKRLSLTMKYIHGAKISLDETLINENLDLFYLPDVSRGYFLSKNLYDEFKKNDITGFDIKEQEII